MQATFTLKSMIFTLSNMKLVPLGARINVEETLQLSVGTTMRWEPHTHKRTLQLLEETRTCLGTACEQGLL